MHIAQYRDYRDYLKDVFEARLNRNSHYSIRAFARDLEIAPQILSAVFNRKKGISADTGVNLASRLGMNPDEANYFCDLVELAHARSKRAREIAALRLTKYQGEQPYKAINQDILRIVRDWYHIAILELTYVRGFQSDPNWIADRLKISKLIAKQAIARLLRAGLLEERDGRLKKTNHRLTTTHDIPSESIREFHQQALTKAAEALALQTVAERDFSAMAMAIDPERLPEAKSRIRAFRRELVEFLEGGKQSEVYFLNLQLFRIAKV